MPHNKTITLEAILGKDGVTKALVIYEKDRTHFRVRVRDEIIAPRLAEINRATGQENHLDYLSYAAEYAVGKLWQG